MTAPSALLHLARTLEQAEVRVLFRGKLDMDTGLTVMGAIAAAYTVLEPARSPEASRHLATVLDTCSRAVTRAVRGEGNLDAALGHLRALTAMYEAQTHAVTMMPEAA